MNNNSSVNPNDTFTYEMLFDENFHVSLIRLIATPEKYHNKLIHVSGYLDLEFEWDALYLHKEDYENGMCKNALRVSFSGTLKAETNIMDYKSRYVSIIGVFNMNETWHGWSFSGAIQKISRLDARPSREEI